MRYSLSGADRQTGEDIELVIEAEDEVAAVKKAGARGMLVAACKVISQKSERAKSAAPSVVSTEPSPASFLKAQEPSADKDVARGLTVAAVLSFVWAGLMTLVAMLQLAAANVVNNGNTSLGAWNMLIAVVYVLIGMGLLQRKAIAYNWGLVTNGINCVLGLWQILSYGLPLLVPLWILQVLIIVFLVMGRRGIVTANGAEPAQWLQALGKSMNSRGFLWDMLSSHRKGVRMAGYALATLLGFFALVGITVVIADWWMAKPSGSNRTNPNTAVIDTSSRSSSKRAEPLPRIRVTGPDASTVRFSNWRIEGAMLVGTLDFGGLKAVDGQYTVRNMDVVMRRGSLDFPAGNTSFSGEPVEVRLLLGGSGDGAEVEILVIGS